MKGVSSSWRGASAEETVFLGPRTILAFPGVHLVDPRVAAWWFARNVIEQELIKHLRETARESPVRRS